jgi:hypothetical protein
MIPTGIFNGIKNGRQVAIELTEDNIGSMKVDTLPLIKQKALEIRNESGGNREKIIEKIYQYIIDKTTYEKFMGDYYHKL